MARLEQEANSGAAFANITKQLSNDRSALIKTLSCGVLNKRVMPFQTLRALMSMQPTPDRLQAVIEIHLVSDGHLLREIGHN